jgi:poly(A) polymerase
MRDSTLKRFLRLPQFEEHLELHRVDCLSSHRHLDNYEFVRRKLTELPAEQLRPPRLLTGHDLMAEGYPEGPQLGEILRAVEDAQLDESIDTREEALALVHSRFPKPA